MRNRSLTRSPAGRALQRGMSLIEIIIVIVLIGIVLTFVGSRILGGADRAKANLAKSQVMTLAQKVDQYKMDVGSYPTSLGDLASQPQGSTGWLGPYAKEADLKDPWGNAISYKAPGDEGHAFDLIILGKDGKPGGTSYDADLRNE
ncbi:type II secretion system major pseudopilin GspG [Cognatilysobacter lacus]|uniref:Type II secretion system core protein G n=1 Tax=Cognatilysobacter lacus TaxID=1643323 RepID=A0A5D8Z8L0_9GAMM|nr:type II secretion system major pseudopilin GspG [Lysobacter lacus]TZF91248.1 type II secretion system protein GspG [Lysobacter lacus]